MKKMYLLVVDSEVGEELLKDFRAGHQIEKLDVGQELSPWPFGKEFRYPGLSRKLAKPSMLGGKLPSALMTRLLGNYEIIQKDEEMLRAG